MQQRLTVNQAGTTRISILNDRKYLVAPLTMIVPGVLNGSNGRLYYPEEELKKEPKIWDGVPITLDHPSKSARNPEVLNEAQLGQVFNTRFQDGKLVAEGWFDIQLLEKHAPEILNALEEGKKIELSTGLDLELIENTEGDTYNGESYEYITKNYRPDHLAILPSQKGACSVEDGCGVFNSEKSTETLWEKFKAKLGFTTNELSHSDINHRLNSLLTSEYPGEPAWVVEVYKNYFIYELKGKYYKRSYKRTKSNGLEIGNFPTEVVMETKFLPVKNRKEKPMNSLSEYIENCDCVSDDQKEILNQLDDKTIELIQNQAKKDEKKKEMEDPDKSVPAGTKNEEKEPTVDEWFKSAPPEIQSAVKNAMRIEEEQRAKILNKLTSHLEGEEKEKVKNSLAGKPLTELETLALLVKEDKQVQNSSPLFGPTGEEEVTTNADADILLLPEMEYETA